VFPPPETEVEVGYEFAARGSEMGVLLQYLEFTGVIPRSITDRPCPEEWKELDGSRGIEEAILTGTEVKELLDCFNEYALDEEEFRCYACRYITGESADPEPAMWELEFVRIARAHLAHFIGLLNLAASAAWLILLDVHDRTRCRK
jgi:hypothetical protein